MNRHRYRLEFLRHIALFCVVMTLFCACKKTGGAAESYDILDFSDDTTKAASLVADANEDLNKIKIMYKRNEAQLEELKSAMSGKDTEKVKKITEDLVGVINDGISLGQSSLEKIEQAEAMNINADFKEYLGLKTQSLQKQLDAFEHRRQAARLLKESFGENNPAAIEKAKSGFKEQEEVAQKTLMEAQEISQKANDLAKSTAQKTVN